MPVAPSSFCFQSVPDGACLLPELGRAPHVASSRGIAAALAVYCTCAVVGLGCSLVLICMHLVGRWHPESVDCEDPDRVGIVECMYMTLNAFIASGPQFHSVTLSTLSTLHYYIYYIYKRTNFEETGTGLAHPPHLTTLAVQLGTGNNTKSVFRPFTVLSSWA